MGRLGVGKVFVFWSIYMFSISVVMGVSSRVFSVRFLSVLSVVILCSRL